MGFGIFGVSDRFLRDLRGLSTPKDAVYVWLRYRGELMWVPAQERELLWSKLVREVESLGSPRPANKWLRETLRDLLGDISR